MADAVGQQPATTSHYSIPELIKMLNPNHPLHTKLPEKADDILKTSEMVKFMIFLNIAASHATPKGTDGNMTVMVNPRPVRFINAEARRTWAEASWNNMPPPGFNSASHLVAHMDTIQDAVRNYRAGAVNYFLLLADWHERFEQTPYAQLVVPNKQEWWRMKLTTEKVTHFREQYNQNRARGFMEPRALVVRIWHGEVDVYDPWYARGINPAPRTFDKGVVAAPLLSQLLWSSILRNFLTCLRDTGFKVNNPNGVFIFGGGSFLVYPLAHGRGMDRCLSWIRERVREHLENRELTDNEKVYLNLEEGTWATWL